MDASLVVICHSCKYITPPPHTGRVACMSNGLDIIDNARRGSCPEGLFPSTEIERVAVVEKKLSGRLECIHRGTNFRLRGCSSCGGNVQIKVFDCPLHVACTVKRVTSMIQSCANCPDFQDKETK